jgi:hypothetical protein
MKLPKPTISLFQSKPLSRVCALVALTALTASILALPVPVAAQNSSYSSSGSFGASSSSGFSGGSIQNGGRSGYPYGGFQNGGFQNGFLPSVNQPTVLQSNYVLGGGYRYGANGAFLNSFGQPVLINPIVPYIWPGNRPQFTGGAAFTCRIGNINCNFWKGNSGYYYPFLSNSFLYAPIIFIDSSSSTPLAKLPPPAIQLTDTLKYLDDSLKDKKVADAHYKHLKQRAIDLQRKERSMRIAQGGELDADSEAEIRRDLEGLAKEMSEHVKDR